RPNGTPPPGQGKDEALWASDPRAALMRFAQLGRTELAENATLITALQPAVRKESQLSKIEQEVAQTFHRLQETERQPLLYSRIMPITLENLTIGAGRVP